MSDSNLCFVRVRGHLCAAEHEIDVTLGFTSKRLARAFLISFSVTPFDTFFVHHQRYRSLCARIVISGAMGMDLERINFACGGDLNLRVMSERGFCAPLFRVKNMRILLPRRDAQRDDKETYECKGVDAPGVMACARSPDGGVLEAPAVPHILLPHSLRHFFCVHHRRYRGLCARMVVSCERACGSGATAVGCDESQFALCGD